MVLTCNERNGLQVIGVAGSQDDGHRLLQGSSASCLVEQETVSGAECSRMDHCLPMRELRTRRH